MKRIIQSSIFMALILATGLVACKKDNSNSTTTTQNNNNNNDPGVVDSVSVSKKCYNGSGSLAITGMAFSNITCNIVCASYSNTSHLWPDSYQTTLAFANQAAGGQVLNLVFNGKGFPKTGTYKAVTMYGMMGSTARIADDEVVVHFLGPICSKASQGNTVSVTNDNGKITVKSDKIELFDITGNARSIVSEVNLTRTTTAK